MEARARDAARPQGHEPPVGPRAAHSRPRGLLNHLTPNPADEPFLAEIYAAPDDDAPRQVFADALTERGDPRGEFIALQLSRARGLQTPERVARERELSENLEHRIAWGRPLSKSGKCHLFRGFPDELDLDAKRFDELLGHPGVRLLHKVTGFENGIPDEQARMFLLQPSAARLRSVSGLSRGLVERLDAPLSWPSVGLFFHPAAEHRAHLLPVKELSLFPWLQPVTAAELRGLSGLEKLTIGKAAPGTFEPVTALLELEVRWRTELDWATELAFTRLERLQLGNAPTARQLEGLGVKALTCWTLPDFEVEGALGGMPRLEELTLLCGTDAATHLTMQKVLAAKSLSRLRFVAVGVFAFTNPGKPNATLELRVWKGQKLEQCAPVMELLPADFVTRVVVRPREPDPWIPAGPPPSGLEAIRAAAKVPVELAWY